MPPEEKEKPKDVKEEGPIAHLQEHSVAEFFKKNRQMLGLYGKTRSLTTVVHEFTSNSIDAAEEAGILPDIEVQLKKLDEEYYEVTVTDNGPGLPEKIIGKALGKLLAGTKFHRNLQMRGQQGIGASGAILFSQITTGQPVKVISGNGKPLYVELKINTEKNEPIILEKKHLDKPFKGLAIKALFKDVQYTDNNQNAFEYLKRTSIANPHVQIRFMDPNDQLFVFERSINKIPRRPIEIKPHIKSVNTDEFLSLAKNSDHRSLSAHIKETYDRVGDKFIEDLQKSLGKELKLEDISVKRLDWNTAEKIVKAIQKTKAISPRTDALIPIEEESLKKSIEKILKPETLSVLTRKPTTYKGGFPFQVEVALAFGGESGRKLKDGTIKMDIMRFANRAPLLFDGGGCAITNAINSVDWKRYNIRDIENSPITVIVNISSVHIPYTGAGKQAIAEEEEVIDEIKLALMTAARYVSTHISRKQQLSMKQEKKKMFHRYAYEIAYSLGVLTKQKSQEIFQKLEKIIEEKLRIEELEEKLGKKHEETEELVEEPKEKKPKKGQRKLTDSEEE